MAYTPIIPASGVAGYTYLNRTRSEQQALFRAGPAMQRDVDAFSAQIQDVHSSDELLDNYQLLKVALGAFGLDDDLGNRGFLKAVLDSDPSNQDSFVNRLADKSYLEFAKAFNFAGRAGPQLDELKTVDAVKAQVQALPSADALVEDGDLLRAALDTFGLGTDVRNTHFLKLVLNSDLSDPTSFANALSDKRYAQFSESFGFGARLKQTSSIFGLAEQLSAAQDSFVRTQEVLDQPQIISAVAKFFGLNDSGANDDFWGRVLDSDLTDEASFANQLADPRYAAISRVFGFGDPERIEAAQARRVENGLGEVTEESPLELAVSPLITGFTAAMLERGAPYTDASDFFADFDGLFATLSLMDLPRTGRFIGYAGKVLETDPSDPSSLINLENDPRYAALQSALNFQPVDTDHSYPDGFADAIAQRYVDQQFEIQVGTQDPSMRVALSFDRDLDDVVTNGVSVNARWYAVMASGPLREVFETVFSLPDGFGTLDVDQQLTVFKERAEAAYGSEDLSDLNTPELRDRIRNGYLFRTDLSLQGTSSSASAVLALLTG